MRKTVNAIARLFVALAVSGFSQSGYAVTIGQISSKDASGVEKATFAVGEPISFQMINAGLGPRSATNMVLENPTNTYGLGWNFGDGCAYNRTYSVVSNRGISFWISDNGCRSTARVLSDSYPLVVHSFSVAGQYTVYGDVVRDGEWLLNTNLFLVGWAEKTITVAANLSWLPGVLELILE